MREFIILVLGNLTGTLIFKSLICFWNLYRKKKRIKKLKEKREKLTLEFWT